MASSTNTIDELKSHPHRLLLPDTERLSIPDEEDEDDLDETSDSEDFEKESSPILTTDRSIPIRPQTDLSIVTTSIPKKKSLSRSYKYVQLERALILANILENKDDRIKLKHDYLESIRENKFEEFLQISYQKLQDHNDKIKQERILKSSQTFTFVNLENNFLARDPARDIKLVFIDDTTTTSSEPKITGIHRNSTLSNQSDDNFIETFYKNRSRRLLRDPSHARDEITLFARRAGERLYERLPHLDRVPHRVKIVDERETKGNIDEHTLSQIKHKHALSLITKRRQLIMKMMTQTKKNQIKMEKLNIQKPLTTTTNNSSYCRELLERVNQIEQMIHQEQVKRPQTGFISRRALSKTTNYSSTQTTTTITGSITPSFSSCSTPFQDALSIYHVEKTNNVHVILPKRPLTAPIKNMDWMNYC